MTPQLRAQREIRKIRREMRLSQKAFAELMGVSTQTIWMWECGKKNPLFQKGSMLYIWWRGPIPAALIANRVMQVAFNAED